MQILNLDHLHTFMFVIESGSFSAAAVRLGITQPGVSQQIRQLEKRLGGPLIERVGRRARPTPAGAELLAHAGRIEEAVSSAIDAVSQTMSGGARRLRIGTGSTACISLLPPVLRDLRRTYPRLEIAVSTGTTPDVVRRIEDNEIDIGLVTLPAAGRALDVRPVLDDEFVAVAPPDHELPEAVTAAYLSGVSVLLEMEGNTRRMIDDWFARNGAMPSPSVALKNDQSILAMVEGGLGCGVLPRLALRGVVAEGLHIRSLSPPLFRRLGVVVRHDKPLHRVLRDTLRALEALGSTVIPPPPPAPAERPEFSVP
jgi:DNA-binding transcriptional LysR family regulator